MRNHYRNLFIVYYYYMLKQKKINSLIGEYYISGYFLISKLFALGLMVIVFNLKSIYFYTIFGFLFLIIDNKVRSITKKEVLLEIKHIENIELYRNIVICYGIVFFVLLIIAVAKVLYIMEKYQL